MNLPKKGKVLRHASGSSAEPIDYADALASALRAELGDTHRAVKTVMKWTGASERAVKNWMSGERGPHGRYLVKILRHSDAALQTILAASRRLDLLDHLLQNVVEEKRADDKSQSALRPSDRLRKRSGHDPSDDPNRDPDNDPNGHYGPELSPRQKWFLSEIAERPRANALAIRDAFGVSVKTAKRDIAALKASGRLQFIGTRRRGRYIVVNGGNRI